MFNALYNEAPVQPAVVVVLVPNDYVVLLLQPIHPVADHQVGEEHRDLGKSNHSQASYGCHTSLYHAAVLFGDGVESGGAHTTPRNTVGSWEELVDAAAAAMLATPMKFVVGGAAGAGGPVFVVVLDQPESRGGEWWNLGNEVKLHHAEPPQKSAKVQLQKKPFDDVSLGDHQTHRHHHWRHRPSLRWLKKYH